MDQRELKELLETAVLLTKDGVTDSRIYDTAEILRKEIRKNGTKKFASKDGKTLLATFDSMYYETVDERPDHLLKLFPLFHFLCCTDKLDWGIVDELNAKN